MDVQGIPSDLLPYVYSYLVAQNLSKAAKALKKESKVSVQAVNGPGLFQFYELYLKSQPKKHTSSKVNKGSMPPAKKVKTEKGKKTKNTSKVHPQDSGSESDDEMEVDKVELSAKKIKGKKSKTKAKKTKAVVPPEKELSSESSSEREVDVPKPPVKPPKNSTPKTTRSKFVKQKPPSGSSSSSDSESPPPTKVLKKEAPPSTMPPVTTSKKGVKRKWSSSSDSDSDSDHVTLKSKMVSMKAAQMDPDSSGSSSSSSEDEELDKEKTKTAIVDEAESSSSLESGNGVAKATKTAVLKSPAIVNKVANGSSESSSASEEEETESSTPAQSNGTAIKSPATFPKRKKKNSDADMVTPFRRVGEGLSVDPRLQDNSFEAKGGSKGSWGERANKDLKFTKGRSFRHEKTKKKRGSYKGGAIDTNIYSIKFDD